MRQEVCFGRKVTCHFGGCYPCGTLQIVASTAALGLSSCWGSARLKSEVRVQPGQHNEGPLRLGVLELLPEPGLG